MERLVRPQAVSVVIPVYNEAENLPELIERCLAACATVGSFEIIFVDDGSRDGSQQIVEDAARRNPGRIVGLCLNRNYGQHAAVMAGLAATRGDVVVTLDADLQNPPEEIPRVVAKIREGYDVVGSVRSHRQDHAARRLASRIVNKITALTTGEAMSDFGCMLRGYRRYIVDAMLQCREHSTFIPVLANRFAQSTIEIEVAHAPRTRGHSKYSVWRLVNLQLDLLTATTQFPLRLLSWLGLGISVLGFGFGLSILALRLIYGSKWAAEGVFTLFAVLFILVGFEFIGLGLLGEYLGRIYDDVRARPRYFVDRIVGSSALEPPTPREEAGRTPVTQDRVEGVRS